MKRSVIIISLLIIAALFVSIWLFRSDDQSVDKFAKRMPVAVTVTTVKQMNIPIKISAVGTLVALHRVAISPEIAGQVAQILFKEGEYVTKGTPLMQLDATIYQANLKSSKADLNLSELNYKRMQELAKRGAQSKEAVDRARADLQDKRASVAVNQAYLQKMTLIAPFDGTLGAKQVHLGEYVKVGQPLVNLVDTQQLKVNYWVPEKYLPQLKIGQAVIIHVTGMPHRRFKGKVFFIAPAVDVSSGSVEVQAQVLNAEQLLTPGQFVKVTQILGTQQYALVVPEESLMPTIAGQMVYRVEAGKAVATTVKIGDRFAGNVQILQGLKLGNEIVATGQQRLKDGSAVKYQRTEGRR